MDIKFEHISGQSNELADALSRLVNYLQATKTVANDEYPLLKLVEESFEEIKDAPEQVKLQLGSAIMKMLSTNKFLQKSHEFMKL